MSVYRDGVRIHHQGRSCTYNALRGLTEFGDWTVEVFRDFPGGYRAGRMRVDTALAVQAGGRTYWTRASLPF